MSRVNQVLVGTGLQHKRGGIYTGLTGQQGHLMVQEGLVGYSNSRRQMGSVHIGEGRGKGEATLEGQVGRKAARGHRAHY